MFGFVKAPALPPWPARIESEAGGMMKVVFFGTGESSVINKSNWVPYTPKAMKKVNTSKNKKRWGAFKTGLQELQSALELKGNNKENETPLNREEKKVKAAGLRKEQLENERKFKETIIEMQHCRQWRCSRCDFKTGLKYKAKAHAIVCNSMLRARKHRNKSYSCLKCTDSELFKNKKELRNHTKKTHGHESSFICVDHLKPVKLNSRPAFLRHRKECHPEAGLAVRQFRCVVCKKLFKRNYDLTIHVGRIHPKYRIANDIILDIVYNIKSKSSKESTRMDIPLSRMHRNIDSAIDSHRQQNVKVVDYHMEDDVSEVHLEVDMEDFNCHDQVNVSNPHGQNSFNISGSSAQSDEDASESHEGGDVDKPRSNSKWMIGSILCEKEIEIEKRKQEFIAKFRLALADEYKAAEEENMRRTLLAESRKRKNADKKAAVSDQPRRKSSRLESVQNEKLDKDLNQMVVTQLIDDIIENMEMSKTRSYNEVDECVSKISNPSYASPPSVVLELTVNNFSMVAKSKELMLVMFYSPSCKNCLEFQSEYEGAATELDSVGITLAKVDGTREKELSRMYNVRGWPTLKIIKKGDAFEYNGKREKRNIVHFMKLQMEKKSEELNNVLGVTEIDEVDEKGEGVTKMDEVESSEKCVPSGKSNYDNPNKKYKCHHCNDRFKTKSKLTLHIFRMHEVKNPSPVCHRTWCNKEFSTTYKRNQHSDRCFLTCPICNKTFTREDRYEMHQRAEAKLSSRLSFMV